jgi:hypothetical protein
MKKSSFIILICILTEAAISQPQFSKVLERRYSDCSIKNRIENSGIYGIASFDVVKGEVFLTTFDSPEIISVSSGKLQKNSTGTKIGLDIISGVEKNKADELIKESQTLGRSVTCRKSFVNNVQKIFVGDGGEFTNSDHEKVSVRVLGRTRLVVSLALNSFAREFQLDFPSNLAYADFIGLDGSGHSFFLVETYLSEIPLQIQREVYTLSAEGKVMSVLELPEIHYCSTVKDLQIDEGGNLFHLMTEQDKFSVVEWSGLTTPAPEKVVYPAEYRYSLHFNNIVPAQEPFSEIAAHSLSVASRTLALRIGESYVLHKYFCTAANLTTSDKTAPDGDIVRTPLWLMVGENARVAYKWGGFNTLDQYDVGLKSGNYAADINTNGVSSYAVGVDCSGFVSRCWQMSYHSSTSDMPSITTQYSSWDSLKPGDAIHKVGHVRLFVEKAQNGALKVVESSGRDWGVSYWTYTPSELSGVYTPRCYTGMTSDYSIQRPELLSVVASSGTTARLLWKCDTAQVLGYRIYESSDGTNWSILSDETLVHSTTAEVALGSTPEYYRVSSVLNNGAKSESNWSNALGAANFAAGKKYLIVDGFERENASWRGSGHVFATRYGASIGKTSAQFESARNSQLIAGTINLNSYDGVFWILGDEGAETETFSSAEETLVKNYLEEGGRLFVSGSEVGWDLYNQGTTDDKNFYNNYFKAAFVADNAGASSVMAVPGTALAGCNFVIGQTYVEDFPDEIGAYGGSTLCVKYSNGKGAGIEYTGKFGSAVTDGKLMYLAFPLETTANDSAFDAVIGAALKFFSSGPNSVKQGEPTPSTFVLQQNYPNPFNPGTHFQFGIPPGNTRVHSQLTIYDLLGQEVASLVDGELTPGNYSFQWDGSGFASGVYIYTLRAGGFAQSKRMVLMK